MRQVAHELGSSPMRFTATSATRRAARPLLDQLAGELPRTRLSRDPRRRLHQACRAMRDGLAANDWVVEWSRRKI